MSQITTHVLDTSRGLPAAGIDIELFEKTTEGWQSLTQGTTNQDGRVSIFLADEVILNAGTYRMHFATKSYLKQHCDKVFYPYVDVVFELAGDGAHYHIPLLLSPFGYSTYRGS
ncbi:MAG: hydroxyisourate hydrolase [Enterobacterales bacterium]|nr:hydroxyisourate hydrolase [Enterobacterales bacterium]